MVEEYAQSDVVQEYLGNACVGVPDTTKLGEIRTPRHLRQLSLDESEDLAWM